MIISEMHFFPTASVVTYSIVSGNTYDSFFINNFTGEIRVNKPLDYENITTYHLNVEAWDGYERDHAVVIINIENLNDNPPVFLDNYTKTIEEEKLYEGCIVKVSNGLNSNDMEPAAVGGIPEIYGLLSSSRAGDSSMMVRVLQMSMGGVDHLLSLCDIC